MLGRPTNEVAPSYRMMRGGSWRMENVSPTRSELLARRRRAALAGQGRDLLADKRTALIRAFTTRSAALL
ncbi:MAG: hypothetical protein LH624_15505 [Cryobacterium sp.]|nr:hypothetical protein [Cryobacterium sp.]